MSCVTDLSGEVRRMQNKALRPLLGLLLAALSGSARLAAAAGPAPEAARARSDVPMTRPGECLAVVDGIGRRASFVELPGGSLMASLGRNKVAISKDGGLTWSCAAEMRETDGTPVQVDEVGFVRLKGNAVGFSGLIWDRVPKDEMRRQAMAFWRSEDGGKTWQKPVPISDPACSGVVALHDTLVRTSSGRLILPVFSGLRHARDPLLEDLPTPWVSREPPIVGLRDNQFTFWSARAACGWFRSPGCTAAPRTCVGRRS
jgi:hypothetical protein